MKFSQDFEVFNQKTETNNEQAVTNTKETIKTPQTIVTPTINIAGGGGVAQTSRDVALVNSEQSLVSTKEKSTEEKVSFVI